MCSVNCLPWNESRKIFSLVLKIFSNNIFQTYLVVAGHTGVGVYPESSKQSDLHLSISQVAELQEVEYDKKNCFKSKRFEMK